MSCDVIKTASSTISFKSVGITSQAVGESIQLPSIIPIGIKTPLKIGKKYGILEMHTNLSDALSDNLRNLILTNWGERLGQYYFGANLRPLTTEYANQESFDSEAVIRIKSAVKKWMPFINLIDYTSEYQQNFSKPSTGLIKLEITYSIPTINVPQRKLKINLYVL